MGYGCTLVFTSSGGAGSENLQGAGEIHLKEEINCKEHFSGQCDVLTYELDELVGTKVRDEIVAKLLPVK